MNYRYLKLNLISILATEISGTILMLLFEMDASRTPNKSIMKYRLKMDMWYIFHPKKGLTSALSYLMDKNYQLEV